MRNYAQFLARVLSDRCIAQWYKKTIDYNAVGWTTVRASDCKKKSCFSNPQRFGA